MVILVMVSNGWSPRRKKGQVLPLEAGRTFLRTVGEEVRVIEHVPTGRPAQVFHVGVPEFESAATAFVAARHHVHGRHAATYRCELRRVRGACRLHFLPGHVRGLPHAADRADDRPEAVLLRAEDVFRAYNVPVGEVDRALFRVRSDPFLVRQVWPRDSIQSRV